MSNEPARTALILAQSSLRRWTELYARLQNECGEVTSRKLDYNLPPADHVKALEAIAEALPLLSETASRTYWMIERNSKHKHMPPTEPVLWFRERQCYAQGDKDIWTPHADKARHFATQAEAEEYVRNHLAGDKELYDPAPDVTGHMDCPGPTHAEIDAMNVELSPMPSELLLLAKDPLMGPAIVKWGRAIQERFVMRTESVPLKYTDAIVDAPRQLLAYAETPGRTLEGARIHLRKCGVNFDCWPDWAHENGHLTKSGLAELVHRMMEAARG